MILDEFGLTWHATQGGMGDGGARWTEYRCLEHPRLSRLVQRPNSDSEFVETYHVAGIGAQHWHTAAEAIEAMEANP